MTEQERALIRFAGFVIDEHRNDGYPGDVDGGWLQDKLVDCGVLEPVRVTEPCNEDFCACADCDNIPGECYRLAPGISAAIGVAENK